MTNRRRSAHAQLCWVDEQLESRQMLTTGTTGVVNIVEPLGTLTKSAALAGVAATAQIPSEHSVTFAFTVQSAGDYTLLVRHTGDGLTLKAQTPAGVAMIDPGPAGPFEVIHLKLSAANYEITASASGNQSVFVDWELMLNSGVGQTSADLPTVIVPLAAGTTSTAAAIDSLSSSATSAASNALIATSPSIVGSAGATSSGNVSIYLVAEPVGRLDSPAIAPRSVGAPNQRPVPATAPAIAAELDAALLLAIQPGIPGENGMITEEENNSELVIEPIQLTTQATSATVPTSVAANLTAENLARFLAEQREAPAEGAPVSLASISPGVLLGAAALAIAARGRIKKTPGLPQRSARMVQSFKQAISRTRPLRPVARLFDWSFSPRAGLVAGQSLHFWSRRPHSQPRAFRQDQTVLYPPDPRWFGETEVTLCHHWQPGGCD